MQKQQFTVAFFLFCHNTTGHELTCHQWWWLQCVGQVQTMQAQHSTQERKYQRRKGCEQTQKRAGHERNIMLPPSFAEMAAAASF
jgi:hypothetical protein